jgi:hypothetical protein
MKHGDKFTIEGIGYSKKGHLVVNGRSTKTNRKMKAVRQVVYEVKDVVMGPVPSLVYINGEWPANGENAVPVCLLQGCA